MTAPLVSAIIPTRNRPALLLRAVASALRQPGQNVEVIVIIDGPDPASRAALSDLAESRLRIIELSEHKGASHARNVGIKAARGEWVAFLDDDDEWLPQKVALQLEQATRSQARYPVVSGKLIVHTHGKQLLWPRRNPYLPICDYLFSRSSWSYGEGVLSTITLFAPRELALAVPFTPELRKYQDFDWILRALAYPGAALEFVDQPIAIWHVAEGRKSVSNTDDWRWAWDWIRSRRSSITPLAYSGFLATQVAPQAARQRCLRALPLLLADFFVSGRPTLFQCALFLSVWLAPRWLRRLARTSQARHASAALPVGANTTHALGIRGTRTEESNA